VSALKVKKNLLLLVQLPPPVHGVSRANQRLIEHPTLSRRFNLRVLRLNPAATLDSVGSVGIKKVAYNAGLVARLLPALNWADAAYLTPGSQGAAVWRDRVLAGAFALTGTPYILHHHCSQYGEDDRGEPLSKRSAAALRYSGSRARGHLLLGDTLRAGFEGFIAARAATRSVGNGVAIPSAPLPEPGRPLRLGFLGNLVHYKGFTDTLEILAKLPGVELDVVGGFGDAGYRREVDARVEALGLGRRVLFHGPCYDESAWRALSACHLLVFTSNWREGLPLVWLEAMAHGLPVVSSDIGLARQVLAPIDPRLVQPIGDPDAFVRAIVSLTEDRAAYAELRATCRRVAEQQYSTDAWVARVTEGIAQLLDN
jgi:glycosyltransferase involved in cell wall biosynthesis